MTTTALQRPSVLHIPEAESPLGREAVDLARSAGLELDPWQAFVLERSLARNGDRWASFEVGVNVPRQNGKNAILEARELAGLFLLGERLIIHAAHLFDTSLEAFRRLLYLIEETPELDGQVKRVHHSHGKEGLELRNGSRIRFRTRSKGAGRGFSGDCLILDEAMFLPEDSFGDMLPLLSARPNPQVWFTGSAVDQEVHHDGVVWARVRERGLAAEDDSLAYFEWSADLRDDEDDPLNPSEVHDTLAADRAAWARANPALGIRIDADHVENERRSMGARSFAVERLGIGDWPDTSAGGPSVFDIAAWRELEDPASAIEGPVVLAVDVRPDRGSAAIVAAGIRADELVHLEVVDHRRGTGWIVERLAELEARHSPSAVLVDGGGPGASLAAEIGATEISTVEYARACGLIFDLVDQGRLRHLGTRELEAAIRGASTRPLVDSWAWSRKNSKVDITPLVAATLAAWYADQNRGGLYAMAF